MRRRGSIEKGIEIGIGIGSGIENCGRDIGIGIVSEIMIKVEGEEIGIIRKGNGIGIGEGIEIVIVDIFVCDYYLRFCFFFFFDIIFVGDLDFLIIEFVFLIIEFEK